MAKSSENSVSSVDRFLTALEKIGNKIPDPALLFFYGLLIVWVLSALLSQVDFNVINPVNGNAVVINNQLTGDALAYFLANMVPTFTSFAPMGIVLVAMLGVGVADASGFIHAGLKKLLLLTPEKCLTPILVLVAILSHTAADAGYVLVIPLGGIIFHAAGRHPLAGIAAAFAGVSGGFAANMIPAGIDPLLAGFTQSSAQIIDPHYLVNPLANYYFSISSSFLIIAIAWYITDKVIEPHLSQMPIDEDVDTVSDLSDFAPKEKKAFYCALLSMVVAALVFVMGIYPENSSFRADNGDLTATNAPLMQAIVPIIFILFLIPGAVFGRMMGKFQSQGDVIKAMQDTLSGMSNYIVMAFFCAQFLAAFSYSNIGTLLAVEGAMFLKMLNLPAQMTIIGIILLTAFVNIFIGSSSAKWALIAPIIVPMLMMLGIAPELSQAAYRVGDSVSNIISPLMVFFPLVVVYCQKYVKNAGIGTLVSLMLPYSLSMLVGWGIFLLAYWWLYLPLGIQAQYYYLLG